MAIFYSPPQPFIGGAQPLAPRELTPPSGPAPPAVDNPPFGLPNVIAPETFIAIRQAWEPAAPWPREGPQVVQPFIPGVTPDNPPFGLPQVIAPEIYGTIRYAWEPGPARPWFGYELPPRITAVPVDNPPFGVFARVSPEISAAVRLAWEPGPPWPQPPRYAPIPPVITAIDNPPRYTLGSLMAQLVTAWQPGPPAAQGWRWLVQPGAAGPSPDNPPFGQYKLRADLWWQPGPPAPYQQPPRQIVSIDTPPPYGMANYLAALGIAWQAKEGPQQRRYGRIESVDNPPFPGVVEPLAQWLPVPPPLPWQGYRRVTKEYVPDNPPFRHPLRDAVALGVVLEAWLPAAPLPWMPRFVAAAAAQVLVGYLVARVKFLPAVQAEIDAKAALDAEIESGPALGSEKDVRK